MVIMFEPELETAVRESAERRGVTAEAVVLDTLRERFLTRPRVVPQDDWERQLFGAAKNYGVAIPPEALTSEGMYE